MDIEEIKKSTINDLKSIIDEIKSIQLIEKLSYTFNTIDIQNDQFIEKFLNKIQAQVNHDKYKYIYTFFLQDNSPLKNVYENYKNAKKNKKSRRAYARLNGESHCLYVGSSNDLTSRIKQHLGFSGEGIYAMQLKYWCDNLNFDINIDIYSFNNNISKKAFQAFEDGVWDSLKPMLGRQGKK